MTKAILTTTTVAIGLLLTVRAGAQCSIEVSPATLSAGSPDEWGAYTITGLQQDINGAGTITVNGTRCTFEYRARVAHATEECEWLAPSVGGGSTAPATILGTGPAQPIDNLCATATVTFAAVDDPIEGDYARDGTELRLGLRDASLPSPPTHLVLLVEDHYRRLQLTPAGAADLTTLPAADRRFVSRILSGHLGVFLLYGTDWRLANLQSPNSECRLQPDEQWCTQDQGNAMVVCLRSENGVISMTNGHPDLIRPDTPIEVRVLACPGDSIEVSVVGERGDGSSGVLNSRESRAPAAGAPGAFMFGGAQRYRPRKFRLGHFRPGDVLLRARYRGRRDWDWSSNVRVVATYWGALRIGVGVVFGEPAVPHSYTAGVAPGSSQREVMFRSTEHVAVEVVVGATAYLPLDRAHRLRRPEDFFGVYLGFGVLSATATGLDGLTSIYVGAEFEIIPEMSVVVAAVLRRGQHLSDGFEVGSPVMSDASPTGEVWGPGVGLVLNVSPEIFRFTAQGE